MSEWLTVLLALLAGGIAGLVFFRGLWLTLRQLPRTRHPLLLFMASLLLRFSLVLTVLYLVARAGEWPPLLAAAAGFILARFISVQQTPAQGAQP